MEMVDEIELITTRHCTHCPAVADFLDTLRVKYTKRVVDDDPELETDLLAIGICSSPTLKKGENFLKSKDIVQNARINGEVVKKFIGLS